MDRKLIAISLSFFLLALICILFATFDTKTNLIYSFFLLLGLGLVVSLSVTQKLFFVLSFSINSIFSIFFYYYFYEINGSPFIGGGDDEFFYRFILSTFKNGFTFGGLDIIFYRFWFFIYIYYHYAAFLDVLGIWDANLLHLIFLSCFFGALINVMVYSISKQVFDIKIASKATFICVFFPYLIFNYATLLRETLVIFLLFLSISFIIIKFPLQKAVSLFSLSFGVLSAIGIRLETGFVNIFMVLGSWIKSRPSMKILSISILIFGLLKFGPFLYEKRYKGQDEFYNTELQSAIANQTGLGAKLAAYKDNPIGMGAYSFLAVYAPIPPIQDFNRLDNIFNGLGAIFWYFMIPIAAMGIYKYDEDKRFKIMSLIVLLMFFFISYKMQAAIRHRVPLAPIVIMFYSYGLYSLDKRFISISRFATSGFLVLGLFTYLVLKYFL